MTSGSIQCSASIATAEVATSSDRLSGPAKYIDWHIPWSIGPITGMPLLRIRSRIASRSSSESTLNATCCIAPRAVGEPPHPAWVTPMIGSGTWSAGSWTKAT